MRRTFRAMVGWLLIVAASRSALAAPTPSIVVTIEEPEANEITAGIRLVRGYAVGPEGIVRVEWYLDETAQGALPYGGPRGDVEAAFPGYPGSGNSGFAAAWNYGLLAPGEHTVRVRAFGPGDTYNDAELSFSTARFGADTFVQNNEISLGALTLDGVLVGGNSRYKADLEWSVAAQQWVVRNIHYEGETMAVAPPSPANLTATKAGGTVLLTWTDTTASELGYYVERRYQSPIIPGLWSRIAVLKRNKTSWVDEDVNLAPAPIFGSKVEYRIQSFTETIASPYSNVDSVTRALMVLP